MLRFDLAHPQPPFLQLIAKKTEEKNRDKNRQAAYDQRIKKIDSDLRVIHMLTWIALATVTASAIIQTALGVARQ